MKRLYKLPAHMKNFIPAAFLVALCLTACNDESAPQKQIASEIPEQEKLHHLGWMLGAWEVRVPGGIFYEDWERSSDSAFAGVNYVIQEGDTVLLETIRIVHRGDAVLYLANVVGQNDNEAIPFTMTDVNPQQVVFYNAGHDFPNQISYTSLGTDSARAEIAGLEDGVPLRRQFHFRRMKSGQN